MRQRIKAVVTGKVQGVFFRASTKQCADELSLSGWVRNTRDGTVELEAEGDDTQINKFVDWLQKGPDIARVAHVDVERITVQEDSEFKIRHS